MQGKDLCNDHPVLQLGAISHSFAQLFILWGQVLAVPTPAACRTTFCTGYRPLTMHSMET